MFSRMTPYKVERRIRNGKVLYACVFGTQRPRRLQLLVDLRRFRHPDHSFVWRRLPKEKLDCGPNRDSRDAWEVRDSVSHESGLHSKSEQHPEGQLSFR
jgi:hypothetical protein